MSPQRAANAIAGGADRWERALAELHRIDARIVARNGRGNGARNDTHHVGPAEAYRRAAVADGEAALWRATAEVLLLDREIWREHAPACRHGPLNIAEMTTGRSRDREAAHHQAPAAARLSDDWPTADNLRRAGSREAILIG